MFTYYILRLKRIIFSLICSTIIYLCFSTAIAYGVPSSPAWGRYLVLNGNDDYAVLDFKAHGLLLKEGTEELTAEAWIYPISIPAKNICATILSQQVAMELVSYDNPNYQDIKNQIDWKKDDLLLVMSAYVHDPNNNSMASTGFMPMTVSLNKWHHVAFQAQKGRRIWICDNKAEYFPQEMEIGTDFSDIEQKDFVLGGYGQDIVDKEFPSYIRGSFIGCIDEVRISDIPRYDITNGQLIPQGKFEPDGHTIALWHFDELNPNIDEIIFHDSSKNGYDLIGKNGAHTLAVDEHNKLATTWANIKAENRK